MDYYKKYQEIIADYNREKDRATVEETFARLTKLASKMDEESARHVREGLSEEELALFDLLLKQNISKIDREKVKQASKALLASLEALLASMPHWTSNAKTQADVKILYLIIFMRHCRARRSPMRKLMRWQTRLQLRLATERERLV